MNKIVILGNSGSGKSTFGIELSQKLNIEVLFLDTFVYNTSWDNPDYTKLESEIKNHMNNDKWILDGNFLDHAKERFNECDTIIFLDIDRFTCLKSVLERKRMYKDKKRISRSDNLSERINLSYINWVTFGFYIKSKPKILKLIDSYKNKKDIYILKSRKEMSKFIENL